MTAAKCKERELIDVTDPPSSKKVILSKQPSSLRVALPDKNPWLLIV